jgi:hypothetical protein
LNRKVPNRGTGTARVAAWVAVLWLSIFKP